MWISPLDAEKLTGGRYAELLTLLIETRRYQHSEKPFQLYTSVKLGDGEPPVRVDVDFLAPTDSTRFQAPEKDRGLPRAAG